VRIVGTEFVKEQVMDWQQWDGEDGQFRSRRTLNGTQPNVRVLQLSFSRGEQAGRQDYRVHMLLSALMLLLALVIANLR
jgi:hypothetical protein